ncbi:hypothetical protein NQ318_005703 [Aromia moschata]|uniref:Uncharacterized protein n=1 Tax=Aromia moschata TaxID=1265417 RepID=A0AAV8XLF6_9CUCU|nr:hypothetical protein NQ318_005703 [Aromia moschata]
MEQRVNLKFLVKLGKLFAEAYAMLKEFLNGFNGKEGRESTQDDPRSGWPSMSKTDENIEKIGKLIREDRNIRNRQRMCSPDLARLVQHAQRPNDPVKPITCGNCACPVACRGSAPERDRDRSSLIKNIVHRLFTAIYLEEAIVGKGS